MLRHIFTWQDCKCGFGLFQAPTIPYLGTFLTDLIMLDTALLDFVEVRNSEKGVNSDLLQADQTFSA